MKTFFLKINTFKATFVPKFSNFTHVYQSSNKDRFFRDESATVSLSPKNTKFRVVGHNCHPFRWPQSFTSPAACGPLAAGRIHLIKKTELRNLLLYSGVQINWDTSQNSTNL